jgi:serine protease inhibitor
MNLKITTFFFKTKILFCFLVCMFTHTKIFSQTILAAGDIAFTGYISNPASGNSDEFSFLILKDIAVNTVINFTDNGWLISTNTFRAGEGIATWTSPSALNAGTEVRVILSTPMSTSTRMPLTGAAGAAGSITGATVPSLAATGDSLLAYQGLAASPTFITAIHMNNYNAGDPVGPTPTNDTVWDGAANSLSASALPPGLTTGINAIRIVVVDAGANTERDNAVFNCGTFDLSTVTKIKALIFDRTNWISVDGAPSFTLPSACNYMTALSTITTVGTTSAFTACAGSTSANQSFTVSGTGLTANLVVTPPAGFEVSTTAGSGFGSSVSLTPSSGTVATTTIFIRLASTATGIPSGNVVCSSAGATSQNIVVSGTVNPNIAPTFTQVATICSGATLTPLSTTSNNSITGTWSPALNNTTTTTYTFTPTAGQCATSASMTITVNPNVTPTFTQVAAICSGATLTPLATTSNNSITGTWAPALNNTTTTTYTFTPTAGQCATSASMTITVNPNVIPTFTQVAAICSGASLSALPTLSNNSISGTWLPALNNTTTTTYTFTPTAGQCATSASMTITVNPNVIPTFTQVEAICSGATLTPLATTSNNSITGTWSPALNNTTTTTYTFTPTAGQCATSASMTITVNPNVIPTFTQVAAICSGATLTPLATTSNNSITGTWAPALNNTTTTTYTFTPTAGQCATSASMTITVNPNVIPTFTQVAAICSGATLTPLATTSNNSITGTWSPALNNTTTTTYTFTPTAGQCATSASMTITVNPNVTPTFTARAPICSGSSLTALSTTSNNSITGTWSPALNNTTTTTYTFTPTAGQCATSASMTITVNPNVTPTFTQVAAICSGASLTALSTTSNNSITGTWVPALNNTTTTTYTFTPTAGQCATSASMTIVVGNTTTWTGSGWTNGTPTSLSKVIFAADFTATTSLSFCSIQVTNGANVVIPATFNVTLSNEIDVASGTFTLENNANLLQSNAATNTGNITVKRNTSLKRLDYTYWSSPVANQNALAFSPATLPNRFYTYSETSNLFVPFVASTTNFTPTRGYCVRAPDNFTTLPTSFVGTFTGIPNNGNFSATVSTTSAQGKGYNLIGNPYPSTLNGLSFLSSNSGALYFWTHTVYQGGTGNYASYTAAGGVGASFNTNAIPNGNIQIGQGFMFVPTSATTTSVVFNNSMRTATNNNQFFRTQNTQNDKFWLNLSGANTEFSQILLAYLPETTLGFDGGFDAKQINTAGAVFSSMLDSEKMVIQSRGTFTNLDQVSLGIKTPTSGLYTLGIGQKQGIFDGNQNIFLKDNLTGTTHNLSLEDYTFVANNSEINSRFTIVYEAALGNNNLVFSPENVIVFENNKILNISATEDLKSLKIFDIQGRNIFEVQNINTKTMVLNNFRPQQQFLLMQITNSNNQTVTKKVVF